MGPADALDVVQDAFQVFLQRPDAEALRADPDGAPRLLSAITRNAARNLRRRHHRHVITLRVLEELSGEAAAAALGLTANHVGVLLHRARKQLAQCMRAADS